MGHSWWTNSPEWQANVALVSRSKSFLKRVVHSTHESTAITGYHICNDLEKREEVIMLTGLSDMVALLDPLS